MEILYIRRGIEPQLVVRLPDGHHAAIAMSSTDFLAPGSAISPPETLPLLDLAGLRQAAQLIAQILQRPPSQPSDSPVE